MTERWIHDPMTADERVAARAFVRALFGEQGDQIALSENDRPRRLPIYQSRIIDHEFNEYMEWRQQEIAKADACFRSADMLFIAGWALIAFVLVLAS